MVVDKKKLDQKRFLVSFEFVVKRGEKLDSDDLFAYSNLDWRINLISIFEDQWFEFLPIPSKIKVREVVE